MKRLHARCALVSTALLVLAACGGGEDDADTAAAADTTTQAAATPAPSGGGADTQASTSPLLLTAQDVELYQRGREAEIERVREMGERLKKATNASDSGSIMGTLIDERARQRAAAALIGVDEQRYFRLLETVDEVLRKWQMAKMTADMTKGVDTTTLTAEQRAQMRASATPNYEGLPPQNVELILPKAPLLDSLRMMPALLAVAVAEGRM
ncbi:MAG TPA: hypothetical protein VJ596_10995 [Gemmatimonadaceae bacterium]|nr:hypothetical protein [Gemmatimonadaceae bacterium]